MSVKLKWIIGAIIALIVVAGGTTYGIYQHNKPLTDQEFKALEIDEQFDKAPAGHYVHLRKDDATLYRTTWSAKKIKHYLIYDYANKVKARRDGSTAAKSQLGTNYQFNDSNLVDEQAGEGEIGILYTDLFSNKKFVSDNTYSGEYTYNWYFNSPQQAQKDSDVQDNVTQIVR